VNFGFPPTPLSVGAHPSPPSWPGCEPSAPRRRAALERRFVVIHTGEESLPQPARELARHLLGTAKSRS